jgi:hypothetical protein
MLRFVPVYNRIDIMLLYLAAQYTRLGDEHYMGHRYRFMV